MEETPMKCRGLKVKDKVSGKSSILVLVFPFPSMALFNGWDNSMEVKSVELRNQSFMTILKL